MKPFQTLLACSLLAVASGCALTRYEITGLAPKSTLEDRTDSGALFTPETQSLLRGAHALETIDGLDIAVRRDDSATVTLRSSTTGEVVEYANVPLDQLVPRLHYPPANPPDAFDAFNLMLAEYSRNSIDFPRGGKGDTMTHFRSGFDETAAPWTLKGDYEFQANPRYMPNRMSLTNNCLGPGLWEINATDTSGEIFHAWFGFPGDRYNDIVARVNRLPLDFVAKAVIFDKADQPVDLDRLRTVKESLGRVGVKLADDTRAGYSSQGSRRKLGRGFALIEKDGKLVKPEKLSDLTRYPSHMSEFQEPGKYSFTTRREFDFTFLGKPRQAEILRVDPKTRYEWWTDERHPKAEKTEYIEIRLDLENESLVFGNLPISLLVPTEDYTLHGFGVGVLSAGEPAEQRKLLIERGPFPGFGYLLKIDGSNVLGVNTHERGLEQVFVRTHWEGEVPRFEIILTSYERMVDLVKYEVEVPAALVPDLRRAKLEYIPPIYRTYRDDNLR
jgi:hypothetical protein